MDMKMFMWMLHTTRWYSVEMFMWMLHNMMMWKCLCECYTQRDDTVEMFKWMLHTTIIL
jgi:hypothetical protein